MEQTWLVQGEIPGDEGWTEKIIRSAPFDGYGTYYSA